MRLLTYVGSTPGQWRGPRCECCESVTLGGRARKTGVVICTRYNMRLIYIANYCKHTGCGHRECTTHCTKRVRSGEKLAWLGLQSERLLAYVKGEVSALKGWAFFLWQWAKRARV